MDQWSIVLRNTFHLSRLTRNDLRMLADFFSMLLAFLGRMGNKRRIELLHLGAAAFRACHFVGFMLLQG
jgi:predicted membrane-bound mannosyltransferase